jgi:hypothetical protein
MNLGDVAPLSDIQDGQLVLDSQDIAHALIAEGIDETDCGFTGLVEFVSERGWETTRLYATNWSRPFDLEARYVLIRLDGATAPVGIWPGFETTAA